MLFLGTGAAEMLPNPFCKCRICEHIRKHPAENRRRTSFLYDDATMIDFGPDTLAACHTLDVDLSGLRDVLITHGHDDHFSIPNLNVITMSSTSADKPFTVHLSRSAWEYFQLARRALLDATRGQKDLFSAAEHGFYSLQPHDYFETFQMNGKSVFTVRGNHQGEGPQERSIHYRIRENGHTLLYALDTGLYDDESLEALSGTPVDVLIMDATFGSAELPADSGHLNGKHFELQLDRLAKCGVVTEETRVYATHINHKHDWTHADYQAFFDHCSTGANPPASTPQHPWLGLFAGAHPVTVSHDGMEILWQQPADGE